MPNSPQPPGTFPGGHTPSYPYGGGTFPGGHNPIPGGSGHGHGGGSGGGPAHEDTSSAYSQLYALLAEYGLTSLADFVKQLLRDGITDTATIMLKLQETAEWKARFAGNEMLKQQGLGVLSPAEYLATERSYAQIMKNYGLPQGFYDDPADFAKFIGNNVSAAELQQRVGMYADLAVREDPAVIAQLKSMGMSQGDVLAYMMDPTRAAPLIQRQYQTTVLGAAGRRAGMDFVDNKMLGHLAEIGVTEDQAGQGYGQIGQSMTDANTLAQVYGEDYHLADMEAEVFDHNSAAAKKRKRLASAERAAFGGKSGNSGLGRNSSGSY